MEPKEIPNTKIDKMEELRIKHEELDEIVRGFWRELTDEKLEENGGNWKKLLGMYLESVKREQPLSIPDEKYIAEKVLVKENDKAKKNNLGYNKTKDKRDWFPN